MKAIKCSGQSSKRTFNKRAWLVQKGKASWLYHYHPLEELERRLTL